MDNVGIVVDSLDAAIAFFAELGLELEGEPRSKESGRGASPGWATSASRSR
jgi:catechol 2,3-dioxygenase-like lactoylglutathione lyase family enzyme